MKLKIKKLHPDAIIPKYQTEGSVGMDFHAVINAENCNNLFHPEKNVLLLSPNVRHHCGINMSTIEGVQRDDNKWTPVVVLYALSQAIVDTGLAFALPDGHELQIRPRSGLAFKNSITIVNSPGTVDCFSPDMLIETIDGKKNIENLSIGEIVLSVNDDGDIEKDEVVAITDKGELNTVIIETEDGFIEISDDTDVYTYNGIKKAKDINEEDSILHL